jgi:hypothetical protein
MTLDAKPLLREAPQQDPQRFSINPKGIYQKRQTHVYQFSANGRIVIFLKKIFSSRFSLLNQAWLET